MDKIFVRNKETLCHFYKFFLFLQIFGQGKYMYKKGAMCRRVTVRVMSFVTEEFY